MRVTGGSNGRLLLVNLVDKLPEEAFSVGRRVREYREYDGQLPFIAMAGKYGQELEGTVVNVGGMIG